MRNLLIIFGLYLGLFGFKLGAQALTLESALAEDSPIVILVYTEWSEYKNIYDTMKAAKQNHPEYNFVKVDLNTKDAQYLFEDRRFIVSTIPMVIIAKKSGRINKVISNDCATDNKCLAKELKHFTRQ